MRSLLLLLLLLSLKAWAATPEQKAASAQWLEHGRQRYAVRNYDGAIEAFNQAWRWDPTNSKAVIGLGYCYQVKGDEELSARYMRTAAKMDAEAAQAPAAPLAAVGDMPKAAKTPAASPPAASLAATEPRISPWRAVGRSALLPGWGQASAGHSTRAWVVGGGTVALFGAGWATYFVGESAADQYLGLPAGSSQSRFDEAYASWDTWATVNHTVVGLFAGAYVYNLVDAYLSAGRPAGPSASLHLDPWLASSGAPGLALSANF